MGSAGRRAGAPLSETVVLNPISALPDVAVGFDTNASGTRQLETSDRAAVPERPPARPSAHR
jgi:hypothetical protein